MRYLGMHIHRIQVLLVIAAVLTVNGAIADQAPEAFKTYSNKELGVLFRYPADMKVATTTKTTVSLEYRSRGEHGPVDVGVTVRAEPCLSEDACLATWYTNPSVRQSILSAPKMNGFLVGDNTTDCGLGGSCLIVQHFVQRSAKGTCYSVSKSEWASKRWMKPDIDPEDQKVKDDVDKHFEISTEIAKSFQIVGVSAHKHTAPAARSH